MKIMHARHALSWTFMQIILKEMLSKLTNKSNTSAVPKIKKMFALRNLPPVGDILENLVDSMAEMGVAVGVGWTIMENKLLQ